MISIGNRPIAQARASSRTSFTSVTSFTLNRPTGTLPGDLLIAFCGLRGDSNSTFTLPAGWTRIATVAAGANPNDCIGVMFWREATGSDPTSWTFTAGGNMFTSTASMVAYSGINARTGLLTFSTSAVSGQPPGFTSPGPCAWIYTPVVNSVNDTFGFASYEPLSATPWEYAGGGTGFRPTSNQFVRDVLTAGVIPAATGFTCQTGAISAVFALDVPVRRSGGIGKRPIATPEKPRSTARAYGLYVADVLSTARGYWRLAETGAGNAVNEVSGGSVGTLGTNVATYSVASLLTASQAGSDKSITTNGTNTGSSVPWPGDQTNFSFEFLFKSTQTGGASGNWYQNIGVVGREVGGVTSDGAVIMDSGALGWGEGVGGDHRGISSATFNDGVVHHVCLVRRGDGSVAVLYVDGIIVSATGLANGAVNAYSAIGLGHFFNGTGCVCTIDEFSVHPVLPGWRVRQRADLALTGLTA